MMLLHRALLAVGGDAGFSPSRLFAAAEVGAWYDPSDISTLWQDTAGTTPVTATGQSVARIDDKSGNGKHAIQSTSANRPTWQQDGSGYYYLSFNGTNHYLECASSAIPLVNLAVFIAGFEAVEKNGVSFVLLGNSGGGTDYDKTTAIVFNTGNASNTFDVTGSAGISFVLVNAGTGATPKIVASMVKSATSGSLYINGNGTAVATDSSFTAFSSTNTGSLYLGARTTIGPVSEWLNGRIYGVIIRGATTTATDRESAEDWLNTKIGAY